MCNGACVFKGVCMCVFKGVWPTPLSILWPLLMDAAVDFAVASASPLPSPLLLLVVALIRRGRYRYILGLKRFATHRAPSAPFFRLKIELYDHGSSNQGNTTLFQELFNWTQWLRSYVRKDSNVLEKTHTQQGAAANKDTSEKAAES